MQNPKTEEGKEPKSPEKGEESMQDCKPQHNESCRNKEYREGELCWMGKGEERRKKILCQSNSQV